MEKIRETAEFLLHGSLNYEFRTTVVKELHTENDFREIGQWLKGAKAYYLQAYKDSEGVLKPGFWQLQQGGTGRILQSFAGKHPVSGNSGH